jgi:large subunit ribosomal protein L11e
MKYDPATGIFGMDFYVVLARPGFRVSRRKHCTSRVGASHRITKADSMAYFKEEFEGVVNEDK